MPMPRVRVSRRFCGFPWLSSLFWASFLLSFGEECRWKQRFLFSFFSFFFLSFLLSSFFFLLPGVVHYPPRKHRRPILFRRVSGNQPTSRGGVVSGHNKNRVFAPFSGHTGTTEPHLFFSHLVPLQYPLLYTFFPHGFRVRYIQVTRSAEAETDGLHATVQAVNHCAR